jgi:prepilin-type N-terminal cleavage/methylation domain-containing protein
MSCALHAAPNARRGFTLVELMVVLVILAILSSLTLGGLAVGRTKGKAEVTQFMVQKLSAAIMDRYEEYEDLAPTFPIVPPYGTALTSLRARIREEMPDSWHDVFRPAGSNLPALNTPAGRAYSRYYLAGSAPTDQFAGAECLYMIVTQSGLFPDVLSDIRPEQIGDIDDDGKKEFLDGWKQPISFIRWAPGFSYPLSPIQVADPNRFHDPIDINELDATAFAMFPLIYSGGADESLGLLVSVAGWNNASLATPCTFNPQGKGLVGLPDPDPSNASAYRDNIFSHDLMGN